MEGHLGVARPCPLGLWSDIVPAETPLEELSILLLPAKSILCGVPLGKDQACDPDRPLDP